MEELQIYGPFISKKQATDQGLRHYFTGKPCKHGHFAIRYIRGQCFECNDLRNKVNVASGYIKNRYHTKLKNNPKYINENRERAKEHRAKNINNDEYMQKLRARGRDYMREKRLTKEGRDKLNKIQKNFRERYKSNHGITEWTNRVNTDINYKISVRIRKRVWEAITENQTIRKGSFKEICGCDVNKLRSHLESLWDEKMSWENYSHQGWHIDHIRPCSTFLLAEYEQQKICFNWRNLQPMWSQKNLSKLNNYEPLDELAWVERMQSLGYEGELFLKYEEGNSY